MTWLSSSAAPDDVKFAASLVRPKLGQACCQACMGTNGRRYAFVFDNPGAGGFVWLELPKLGWEQ